MVNFDGRRRQLRWHRQSGEQQRTHRQLLRTEGEERKKKWRCCLLLHVLLLLLLDVGSHRLLLEVAVAREGKKKKHQRLTDRSRGRRSSSSFRWVAESGATAGLWPAEAGDGQRRETEGDEKKEKKKKNCLWKEEIEGKNYTLVPNVFIYFLLK